MHLRISCPKFSSLLTLSEKGQKNSSTLPAPFGLRLLTGKCNAQFAQLKGNMIILIQGLIIFIVAYEYLAK